MPYTPKQYCVVPRCGALVSRGAGGRCPAHARQPWRPVDRPIPVRIRGTHLQRLRRQLFERQPLCVECDKVGRVSIATIRDHIIPIAEGGTEAEANTQALCQSCNETKRKQEAIRGMHRNDKSNRIQSDHNRRLARYHGGPK